MLHVDLKKLIENNGMYQYVSSLVEESGSVNAIRLFKKVSPDADADTLARFCTKHNLVDMRSETLKAYQEYLRLEQVYHGLCRDLDVEDFNGDFFALSVDMLDPKEMTGKEQVIAKMSEIHSKMQELRPLYEDHVRFTTPR